MSSDASETNAQDGTAHAEAAAHREAFEYWGYLIQPDKCGTSLFNRLLEGIAEIISKTFEPSVSPDLTPSQIAAFYRSVGGNYDVLFIETPPSSISFIYRSLGAFHSLQPAPDDDGYSSPTIPALKKKGFVMWQTIQLLLGPEEHVPFLQNAVQNFDVVDPETGAVFPKLLPKECLPERPDDAMETWYEGVAARLKREAEEDIAGKEADKGPRVHVNIDEHGPRTSSDMSNDEAAEERREAAKYFADPLYRKGNRRPPIMRHLSKEPRDGRKHEDEKDRSRLINSVKHILNPFNRDRRRSLPTGRYEDDGYADDDDDDATPIAPHPPSAPRYTAHVPRPSSSHKRPHPPRREGSLSSTDSDSDSDRPPSRRRTPVLRQRRSHDPPSASTQREYFPQYYEERRYAHEVPPVQPLRKEDSPPKLSFVPTKAPLFATTVAAAQMQAQNHNHAYYSSSPDPAAAAAAVGHRPSMAPRTSYRPSPTNVQGVRYSAPPPDIHEPAYMWDREGDRDRHRDRDREREPYEPLSGNSRHRRRSEDIPRERERERERDRERDRDRGRRPDTGEKTRSHERERMRNEWDHRERVPSSRDTSRDSRGGLGAEREREREREGGNSTVARRLAGQHRYVVAASAVQDGVGGRRYPVEQAWR